MHPVGKCEGVQEASWSMKTFSLVEEAAKVRSLSSSTEAINTEEVEELTHNVMSKAIKMGETVSHCKLLRHSPTDYAGDNHLYTSVKSGLA